MTFFRVGPAGIPGSIKTDMNSVLNKKFGTTAQDYPPTDWPADVNLLGELEVKTASGSIASFTDGADDVPLASASFGIVPAGGGGTPADPIAITGYSGMTITHTKRNLLPNEKYQGAATRVNVGQSDDDYSLHLKAGTYTLSATASVTMRAYYKTITGSNTLIWNTYDTSGNGSFTLSADSDIKIWLYSPDNIATTDVLTFQLQTGSTATAYEPYTAPETISDTFGRTVYGGTRALDGTLTETYGIITFTGDVSETWGNYSAHNGYYIDISDMMSGTRQTGVCNMLALSTSSASGQINSFWLGVGNTRLYVIGVYDSMGNTVEAFKTFLSNNPLTIVYPLATSNTFALDPIAMSSYLGDNNIYCETGDTSVDYRSSGTVTTITPTLITKSITDNGTYNAADDNADGYSQVTVNVSGGGSFTPTFTETLIADNTAHASSFTLSDSYSNYDLVKIVWYESGSSSGYVVTTPDILDEIFTVVTKVCINKLNTNLYVCYSKAGLTWTQTNQRTLFVHEIYGITLTNCTMTATDIYKRGGMSASAVTITSLTSLKDYDLFALSSQHSTDGTETMPCSWFIPYPDPDPLETALGNPQPCALEEYNQNNETFYMSEYEMTAAKYFMVQGLVFTPTV